MKFNRYVLLILIVGALIALGIHFVGVLAFGPMATWSPVFTFVYGMLILADLAYTIIFALWVAYVGQQLSEKR